VVTRDRRPGARPQYETPLPRDFLVKVRNPLPVLGREEGEKGAEASASAADLNTPVSSTGLMGQDDDRDSGLLPRA